MIILMDLFTSNWERHGYNSAIADELKVHIRAGRATRDVIAEASTLNDVGEQHLPAAQ